MTIYFLQNPENQAIKIGFTASAPERRMAQLQTGASGRLRLLGSIPGEFDAEYGLHKEFLEFRLNGEWYRNSPELRKTIQYLIDHRLPWFHCRSIRSKFSFAKLSQEWEMAFTGKRFRESEWPSFKSSDSENIALSAEIIKTKNEFFAKIQKSKKSKIEHGSHLDNMKVLRKSFSLSMKAFRRMPGFFAAVYLAAWNEKIA